MSMAQIGVVRNLSLVERGTIATGGIEKAETLSKEETVIFGTGKTYSETVSKAETVIITNP